MENVEKNEEKNFKKSLEAFENYIKKEKDN
jgi:hypothetical protein